MLQAMRALLLLALPCLALLRDPRLSHADPDVRLPPGTHADAHGQLVSGRGLRDTSDFLAAELARRGASWSSRSAPTASAAPCSPGSSARPRPPPGSPSTSSAPTVKP